MPSACASCTEDATLTCSTCREKLYCSKECQQSDWSTHKQLCKEIRDFQTRPATNMRRVLYFPVNETKPKFVWLPVEEYTDECKVVDVTSLTNGRPHKWEEITGNRLTGAKYDGVAAISYDESGVGLYPPNRSVNALTPKPTSPTWCGPLFAICGEPAPDDEYDISDVWDFDMKALSILVAHLITRDALFPINANKIKGFRVLCEGELKSGAAKYQAAEFPLLHPVIRGEGEVPPISEAIGMPLLINKYQTPKNDATQKINGLTNAEISVMFRNIDRKAKGTGTDIGKEILAHGAFGVPPMGRWDNRIGNVHIAPKNGEAIDIDEVKAFADFCRWHLTQYFQLVADAGRNVSKSRHFDIKGLALEECTPQKWATYLADWRKYKQKGVKDDAAVNSRVDGKVSMGFDEESGDRLCHHLLCTHNRE